MEPKRAQGPTEERDGAAPAPQAVKGAREVGRVGLSVAMEEELYRLLGRLLGHLEAMATDIQEPLTARQSAWLHEALESGHELKEHIEALAFLASPEPAQRLVRAPYSVRRMVEHAVRAAGWQATEREVLLVLPPLEQWAERSVNVDVRAIDRVIRGVCEHLVRSVIRGGRVEVALTAVDNGLRLLLTSKGQLPEDKRAVPTELLLTAWQCIVTLHGGRLSLDIAGGKAELWLPLC